MEQKLRDQLLKQAEMNLEALEKAASKARSDGGGVGKLQSQIDFWKGRVKMMDGLDGKRRYRDV